MMILHWDCETRSTVDLRKAGVYVYAMHPSTEVLMIGFAIDDAPVRWFRPGDRSLAEADFRSALIVADKVCAHNAAFERLMLTNILRPRFGYRLVPLERWDCTAARAAIQSLPRSLEGALSALGAKVAKDMKGHALMLRMCRPRAYDEAGKPVWWEDQERIERLAAYMCTDVEGERALDRMLAPMTDAEREVWRLTERMNDRGVPADMDFVQRARWVAYEAADMLDARMKALTQGQVPKATNVVALKRYVEGTFGIDCGVGLKEDDDNETDDGTGTGEQDDAPAPKLDKKRIADLLKDPNVPTLAKEVLAIRREAGKSSVKKYQALIERVNHDNHVRGNLVYHAASTGRYAGAGVQMQNMVRDVRKDFDDANRALCTVPLEDFEARFGPPMTALSQMTRGFLAIPDDCDDELWWADFSAVEARGVAWLAGCSTLVDLFARDGKVYEETASLIYGVPAAQIGKDSLERFVAKQVVLGSGYGMGWRKFIAHCDNFGVTVDDGLALRAISAYREGYHEIPALWQGIEMAAKDAVANPGTVTRYREISFRRDKGWLRMRLPSGRVIWYCRPRLVEVENDYGVRTVLEYDAVNPVTKRWGPERTWGGKLTENAVQGLCRDLLVRGKLRLEQEHYNPILSVHDEVICRVSQERVASGATLGKMIDILCEVPAWAAGFPLKAEGKTGRRYAK